MTKEQAQQIIEAHEIDKLLRNEEEVECLEQNNPELLSAYRAFVKYAALKNGSAAEQRDEIKPCQNKGCGFFNEHENDGFKCSRLFEFELRACHDYRS